MMSSSRPPHASTPRLRDIPVIAVGRPVSADLSGSPNTAAILAILGEIEERLGTLQRLGEESTIDLRWLMGSALDLDLLDETLGRGEVAATITAGGTTRLRDTAIPCVWRVSHRDWTDRAVGEFIEITEIPDLFRSDRMAVGRGLTELRGRSAALAVSDPPSSALSTPEKLA